MSDDKTLLDIIRHKINVRKTISENVNFIGKRAGVKRRFLEPDKLYINRIHKAIMRDYQRNYKNL